MQSNSVDSATRSQLIDAMSEPSPVALLIEDERQIRRFVRTALETEGWHIVEAETVSRG